MPGNTQKKRSGCKERIPVYHSVEFCIEGLDLPYQFKIWDKGTEIINVLVKSGSGILPLVKVGDVLNMKYYLIDSAYPLENVRTAITHVIKEEKGRLKGHYLIGLQILDR